MRVPRDRGSVRAGRRQLPGGLRPPRCRWWGCKEGGEEEDGECRVWRNLRGGLFKGHKPGRATAGADGAAVALAFAFETVSIALGGVCVGWRGGVRSWRTAIAPFVPGCKPRNWTPGVELFAWGLRAGTGEAGGLAASSAPAV